MRSALPGAWAAAVSAAAQATWRLTVALTCVLAIPAAVMGTICSVVYGEATVVPIVTAFALFTVSPFVHELAHAAMHVMLARRDCSIVGGKGGWASGQIIRWALPPVRDGLVAITGPFAAVASGLSVLALPLPYLVAFPLVTLFLVHLLSLTSSAPDGQQLRVSLEGVAHARDAICVEAVRPHRGTR